MEKGRILFGHTAIPTVLADVQLPVGDCSRKHPERETYSFPPWQVLLSCTIPTLSLTRHLYLRFTLQARQMTQIYEIPIQDSQLNFSEFRYPVAIVRKMAA